VTSILGPLTAAYDRGLLVPFIGAGMSSPACQLWEGFVSKLERRARCATSAGDRELVHRAARAVRKLRFGSGETLADAVRLVLSDGTQPIPRQTVKLARIFWPLVVTTNYDDLYLAAAHKAHLAERARARARMRLEEKREPPLLLLGRSPAHCQRVLTSLRQPDVPILWALQGFVGGQAAAIPRLGGGARPRSYRKQVPLRHDALEKELVVGHAEYRRVAMSSESFRRAFAELFRSRSLLFLGSGLTDKYFLDLLSEVIELYGPSPCPHYAFLREGTTDPDFLRQYFGIWVGEIERHDELPNRITELRDSIQRARQRQIVWHFSASPAAGSHPGSDLAGLRIVRDELPREPGEDEWIVFSAGGSAGKLELSRVGETILKDKGLPYEASAFKRLGADVAENVPIWRHKEDPRFVAVNARVDPWTKHGARIRPSDPTKTPIGAERGPTAGGRMRRDIRLVAPAVEDLMRSLAAAGGRHAHSMLFAAGPLRTFAQSHALLQMVRGWARSRTEATAPPPALSLYVIARDVLYDLDARRLDIARNLVPDTLEFWLEIQRRDGDVERYLHVEPSDLGVRQVLKRYDIEGNEWGLDLIPHPCLHWGNWTIEGVRAWEAHFGPGNVLGLETLGVLPGSTLRVVEPSSDVGLLQEDRG